MSRWNVVSRPWRRDRTTHVFVIWYRGHLLNFQMHIPDDRSWPRSPADVSIVTLLPCYGKNPLKTACQIKTRMIYNVRSTSIIHSDTKRTTLLVINTGWCRYVLNMLNLYNLNIPHHVYTIGVIRIEIPCVPYSNMWRENVEKGNMV